MSKRKLMGSHTAIVDRWHKVFYGESSLANYFDQFYNLIQVRKHHAAEVRKIDVAYSAGDISKPEYLAGKKSHESKLKNIKPRLRREFDNIMCQLLIVGNGHKCYICGEHISVSESFNRDHVFPKSLGFRMGGNMMPAHYHCNQTKDQRVPSVDEVSKAVSSYEFAMLTFSPRGFNKRVLQTPAAIDPVFADIIPAPNYHYGVIND